MYVGILTYVGTESGDLKLKFDWLSFINKDPEFWVLMGSKVISRYD